MATGSGLSLRKKKLKKREVEARAALEVLQKQEAAALDEANKQEADAKKSVPMQRPVLLYREGCM
jgi:hypothetical protein